eukprot:jgi/Chrpa1/3210/Chrysochromulina_OHIO_Genome00002390-RA
MAQGLLVQLESRARVANELVQLLSSCKELVQLLSVRQRSRGSGFDSGFDCGHGCVGRGRKHAAELVECDQLGVVGIETLEDRLEGIARTVLLADRHRQAEQRTHAFAGAARLDHLGTRENAVAVGIDQAERLGHIIELRQR